MRYRPYLTRLTRKPVKGFVTEQMLHVAYAAGLRVSELVGLRLEDVTLRPDASILIRGKGRRERVLPLWKETATVLRAWRAMRGDVPGSRAFRQCEGSANDPMGICLCLAQSSQISRASHDQSYSTNKISPHVLRHSIAMLALQATKDIRKVSLWLGHSSTQTTEVYTRLDPTEKLEAINTLTPPKIRPGQFRPPDKLLALLNGKSLMGNL